MFFYSKNELNRFNSYLSQPGPSKEGKRPSIPKGIKNKIKKESGGACAICGSGLGEFAHIDSVYNSRNNHPHN
ncbi:hypothetical protein [Clostridium beijerinckii]|uniref:HNH endonuclease n=1 Tax=Clostridium beijerinckii TaxID=1520 RepID=A0A9Q5CK30_CLOBE|nr:hypothetical protein [Clostridium beijerinckii]AQS05557.1 hypothetical protein CLBIJ_29900 [Clostridium beijerinckii]MBA2884938.1 hypothetical protein [Clostridium beijerinckii]MBA2899688.1 hypothetical protein [Clostridium beijerinckii]MBA2909289.1 hypothetical protein [Clostridium beijerinckii]MBA9014862.1 hypothetical protein [Clostridium beijerinckii]